MSSIFHPVQQALISTFNFLTAGYFHHSSPDLAPQSMKHIIKVGGSYAGIGAAHRIVKHAVKHPNSVGPFKITLISRETHFFWNIAGTRSLIPGTFSNDDIFQQIAPGFAHYPAGLVEVIHGTLTSVDVENKHLDITIGEGKESRLTYDHLIIATGTHTNENFPLKSTGTTETTMSALIDLQGQVQKAKTIVVVGAGPTGCSIAGELAYKYGKSKEVILLARGHTVLADRPAFVSQTALKQLHSLNVDVKVNISVSSMSLKSDGQQELLLATNGKEETLLADLYVPTYGNIPNSTFLPPAFLDAKGYIAVNEYLQVVGAEDSIFAIGDVSSMETPQYTFADKQSTFVAKSVIRILGGDEKKTVYKSFAPNGMMGLQIGPHMGTGHYGNVRLPGFMIVYIRKGLFVPWLKKMVDGSHF